MQGFPPWCIAAASEYARPRCHGPSCCSRVPAAVGGFHDKGESDGPCGGRPSCPGGELTHGQADEGTLGRVVDMQGRLGDREAEKTKVVDTAGNWLGVVASCSSEKVLDGWVDGWMDGWRICEIHR
jgi:hypothetical protein